MGFKTLELTLISAKDLKNVNLIGKMDVYVVVHLSDQPKSKQKTPVHQDGGTHPSWNYTMRFTVDEADSSKPGKFVVFQLKHEHTFGADKDLGEVMVPVRELFDSVNGKDPSAPQFLTYQVKTSSGKAKGELKFSFKFIAADPNTGYGAGSYPSGQSCSSGAGGSKPYPPPSAVGYPPAQSAGAYPPPGQAPYPPPGPAPAGYPVPQQAPVGYPPQGPQPGVPYAAPQGYPPQPGYGYPPQPAGYGYPPQAGYPPGGYQQYPPAGYGAPQKPQKPKKNKAGFGGMGLGAGLIGGAIGGLILGEVIEDSFDGGFDDGGFDF